MEHPPMLTMDKRPIVVGNRYYIPGRFNDRRIDRVICVSIEPVRRYWIAQRKRGTESKYTVPHINGPYLVFATLRGMRAHQAKKVRRSIRYDLKTIRRLKRDLHKHRRELARVLGRKS